MRVLPVAILTLAFSFPACAMDGMFEKPSCVSGQDTQSVSIMMPGHTPGQDPATMKSKVDDQVAVAQTIEKNTGIIAFINYYTRQLVFPVTSDDQGKQIVNYLAEKGYPGILGVTKCP